MQHIFSGWKGKCEYGLMFSNPSSDPMAILSYAMSVYGAAGEGALGKKLQSLHKSVQNTFDSVADSISSTGVLALVLQFSR